MTPWIAALSMGFSRQESWSGLPRPLPGDLLNPGIKPGSPALQADSLPSKTPEKHCMGVHLSRNSDIDLQVKHFKVKDVFALWRECESSLPLILTPIYTLSPNRWACIVILHRRWSASEFVLFKWLATYYQGKCNKIAGLVFSL